MGDVESGNSGSMQSSSTGGDDQEYESRGTTTESISAFFNSAAYQTGGSVATTFDNAAPNLLQLYSLSNGGTAGGIFQAHHHQPSSNEQVSSCFDSLEQSHSFLVNNNSSNNNNQHDESGNNLDMGWPNNKFGSIRSPILSDHDIPNCTQLGPPSAYRINNNNTSQISAQQLQQQQHLPFGGAGAVNSSSLPSHPHLQPSSTGAVGAPPSQENTQDQNKSQSQSQNMTTTTGGGPGRNPKKRSRASRRAPTTVLTTDTTNFRQMVQEFTGIPAPPFPAPGFSTRTRLDLFGGLGMGLGMGMGMGMGLLPRANTSSTGPSLELSSGVHPSPPPPPNYLLRPFPQKILPQPISPLQPQQNKHTTTTTTTSTTGSSGGMFIEPSTVTVTTTAACSTTTSTNFPNPMLPFQSLLQQSPVPAPNINPDSSINLGSKATTDSTATAPGPRSGGENNNLPSWSVVQQGGLGLSPLGNDHHRHQSRCSVNDGAGVGAGGTHSSQVVASLVINGASDNHIRGEGMVDSWICSSD